MIKKFSLRSGPERREKTIYDIVLSNLSQRNFNFNVPLTDRDSLSKIVVNVISNAPEIWYVDMTCIEYNIYNDHLALRLRSVVPTKKLDEMICQMKKNTAEILERVRNYNVPEYDDVYKLYCVFQEYVSYDHGVISGTSYSAYGAMTNKKAVCQGIAQAFCILINRLGYESRLVFGKAKEYEDTDYAEHCWCIVKYEDSFYHIDPTWDICKREETKNDCFDYFLVDDDLIKLSHKWDESLYPSCVSKKDYFITNNLYASSDTQFYNIVRREVFKHRECFTVRMSHEYFILLKNNFDTIPDIISKAVCRRKDLLSYNYIINVDAETVTVIGNYR